MAELQNTLTGTLNPQPAVPPMPTGLQVPETPQNITDKNIGGAINTLQGAQASPNSLIDFQKVMQLTSQQAYKERQTSEMEVEGKAFDPTKVSGGTFASIISNLEAQRGGDVGKIYASTLNAYASAQEQITNRLQFLQGLKQAQDQFKAELKLKKDAMKADKKMAKKQYSLEIKKLNQAQAQWEKEFALAQYKANTAKNTANIYPDTGDYKSSYTPSYSPQVQASFNPDSY